MQSMGALAHIDVLHVLRANLNGRVFRNGAGSWNQLNATYAACGPFCFAGAT